MIPKEIIKKVRKIEIRTRRFVNESLAGQYHSVFKGRGMEFSEVREYTPGDDIRIIDWNVTSRFGHPYVKRFVEERELTVMLMVDLSGSAHFGTSGRMKMDLAIKNCKLMSNGEDVIKNIYVKDGKIARITTEDVSAEETGTSKRSTIGSDAWLTNITVRENTPASSKVLRNR